MSPEVAIRERLLEISALASLVGTRIYMLKLPQRPILPAVRVQLIREGVVYQQRGHGEHEARVQVDAYASEFSGGDPNSSADAVADAIHGDGNGDQATGLSGWFGMVDDTRVLGIFLLSRVPMYEAEEFREVRVRQDYLIKWQHIGS